MPKSTPAPVRFETALFWYFFTIIVVLILIFLGGLGLI